MSVQRKDTTIQILYAISRGSFFISFTFLIFMKGVVDKILGIESKLSGHFRTQWGRLPLEKSNSDHVCNFWKIQ